jgi:hypothetical protein
LTLAHGMIQNKTLTLPNKVLPLPHFLFLIVDIFLLLGERNIRFTDKHTTPHPSKQQPYRTSTDSASVSTKVEEPERWKIKHIFTAMAQWFDRALRDHSNRYALQVAIAYTIGSLFVMVQSINKTFSNTVWVCKSEKKSVCCMKLILKLRFSLHDRHGPR